MDHYIAYHSIELMGHEYEPTERFHFFSRKAESVLRRALGNRVWVVVGKRDGSATTFSLAGVFTPSEVRAESDGFGVVGPGAPFRPSIDVTTRPWFRALLREQQNFSFGFNRIRSKDIVAGLERHLETPDGNAVTIHELCVYAIRHGDTLEEDWRQGDQFSFTERRIWARAAKELASAKQRQAVLPILFADARTTSRLIFRGQIDDIYLLSEGGKSQTTVVVSHLEKLARPPLKTQLTIADSGHRIPAGYIRSYAICRTPRWLYFEEVIPPNSPPGILELELPEPTTESRRKLVSMESVEQELNQKVNEARTLSLEERHKRLAQSLKHPEKVLVNTTVFLRNQYVIAEVLARTNGVCESCHAPAPFIRVSDGTPYLEVHHRVRLADGGEDAVSNADALCPNCHRKAHYG